MFCVPRRGFGFNRFGNEPRDEGGLVNPIYDYGSSAGVSEWLTSVCRKENGSGKRKERERVG